MATFSGLPDLSKVEKNLEGLKKLKWHQKWWGQSLIGISIAVIGGSILYLIL